jgi:hypothetical protein
VCFSCNGCGAGKENDEAATGRWNGGSQRSDTGGGEGEYELSVQGPAYYWRSGLCELLSSRLGCASAALVLIGRTSRKPRRPWTIIVTLCSPSTTLHNSPLAHPRTRLGLFAAQFAANLSTRPHVLAVRLRGPRGACEAARHSWFSAASLTIDRLVPKTASSQHGPGLCAAHHWGRDDLGCWAACAGETHHG